MIYAGIGSRKTPLHIQYLMTIFAMTFNGILRSGGADGADLAFEIGALEKEIYLPSRNFNNNDSELAVTEFMNFKEIEEVAIAIHPCWSACKPFAKLLHTRNVCQVLGKDLDTPCDIVVCWTPDGANNRSSVVGRETGGTGTAISLAEKFDIPVFNLYNTADIQYVYELVKDHGFISSINEYSDMLQPWVLQDLLDVLDTLTL